MKWARAASGFDEAFEATGGVKTLSIDRDPPGAHHVVVVGVPSVRLARIKNAWTR